MPAGCEFTCINVDCKHKGTGFVVVGPWPLGRIELVIEDPKVKENVEFRKSLIKLKKEGRKYVCINYPNNTDIPIEGYRIQKWCKNCNDFWNSDAMFDKGATTLEEAIETSDIAINCTQCQGILMDFDDILKDGIKCPHCGESLQQNRWFSKEN